MTARKGERLKARRRIYKIYYNSNQPITYYPQFPFMIIILYQPGATWPELFIPDMATAITGTNHASPALLISAAPLLWVTTQVQTRQQSNRLLSSRSISFIRAPWGLLLTLIG